MADLLGGTPSDPASVLGEPRAVPSPWGEAVAFDGVDDGILLDANPLAGRDRFTIEVVMKPAADGPQAQRYLHFGAADGDRILLETRMAADGRWYHDAYVHSGEEGVTLVDSTLVHPAGEWHHVALVFDRGTFTVLVDGRRELEGRLEFTPLGAGRTSIGVRLNEVSWYRGEIDRVRISDRPLGTGEMLRIR